MEQQTWATLLGFAGFLVVLAGYLTSIKRDLRASNAELRTELKKDTANLRTELKDDIGDLRTEVRGGFATIDARLISLENRTYDISTRLPAAPPAAKP